MSRNLGTKLRNYEEIYYDELTVPQNATVSSGPVLCMGVTNDGIEVIVEVGDTEIALADTTTLEVKLFEHDTEGGAGTEFATIYTKTASGAETLDAKAELARYAIATDKKRWISAQVSTTDAAATGTINVFPVYIPR